MLHLPVHARVVLRLTAHRYTAFLSCIGIDCPSQQHISKTLVVQARAAANAAEADSAAPLKGAEVGAAAPAKAQSAPDSTDGNGHADYPTVSPTSDLQRCNGMNGIAEHAAPANGKVSKAVRRPKFKKLAKIHLRAQSLGSMKLKKLQKKLLSGVGNADLQDELMRTLRKSSQFKIEGERISLAST